METPLEYPLSQNDNSALRLGVRRTVEERENIRGGWVSLFDSDSGNTGCEIQSGWEWVKMGSYWSSLPPVEAATITSSSRVNPHHLQQSIPGHRLKFSTQWIMHHTGRGTGTALHCSRAGYSTPQRREIFSHERKMRWRMLQPARGAIQIKGKNPFQIRIEPRLCGLSNEAWCSCPLFTP